MKKYRHVLFDLDGTIIDSSAGIVSSIKLALAHYGIEADEKELFKYIGPPLSTCFCDYLCPGSTYDESRDIVDKAVAQYRKEYSTAGIYHNTVYDGVEQMLADVKAAGYITALATSKPRVYAERILRHLSFDRYFDLIQGATLDYKVREKADVIRLVFDSFGDVDRARTVLVGDTFYDMAGARECGIDAIAVLHGFGTRESVQPYDPVLIAENAEQVREFLCG